MKYLWHIMGGVMVWGAAATAGLLPLTQPYIETGSYIAGEGEYYHASTPALGDTWTEFTSPAGLSNAWGSGYMQVQPADGTVSDYTTGTSLEYKMQITNTGIYILWLRWDSNDDASQSFFAGIPELADGPGGDVDWYEVFGNYDNDFNTDPWDSIGGFEANETTPSNAIPMSFNIPAPGTYTLRVVAREDGAALDSWIFQSFTVVDPTNTNPIITIPDSTNMYHLTNLLVNVLANDSGAIATSQVEIVDAPAFGTATPQPDGTILYTHTTGVPTQDTFTYRVGAQGGTTSSAASVVIDLSPAPSFNGNLPITQPYVESAGYVAGEAEFYHDTASALGDTWVAIAADAQDAIANAQGIGYMQALPDGDPATKDYDTGAYLEYKMQISTPGIYNLWLRWDGVDNSSDSIFAGIIELADGPGGGVDWYEPFDNGDADFNSDPWDIWGGFETDDPAPDPVIPMSWNIATAGVYTLRVTVREDGAALDSWIFQMPSPTVTDPTNTNPIITVPDSVIMHHNNKVGISVLENDSGAIVKTSLEIVTPPSFGTATPQFDGRIIYEHTTGVPADDTFTYRVSGQGGSTSSPAFVTITFSSDMRIPNTTVTMPLVAPPTTYQSVDAFPGIFFDNPTAMTTPPGETNRIIVAQRNGEIFAVTDLETTPVKSAFMDMSSVVLDDGNEMGLKGLTFDPEFSSNGYFYVSYCHWDGTNRRVRLGRFETQSGNPNAGDVNSQVLLIDQQNDGITHNIDSVRFGPDDYLYLSIGDEGFRGGTPNGPDAANNSQIIDSNLWSGILRLDPHKRPGNLEPNPLAAVPLDTNGLAFYSIPTNNPFIGTTQFNGIAVNPVDVRTEFYVVGLRNPWQFSFDELTHELWVADVGNNEREEVNVMPAGSNGGWVFYEGNIPGPRPDRIEPAGFDPVKPVWEYGHGSGEFEGFSVSGGFVYRGDKYPEIKNKYIFADYVSANIWTIERGPGVTNVTRIAGEGGVIQFGLHPATEDILMLDIGDGVIRRLDIVQGGIEFPQTLKETGFFADLTDLSPNPGVTFYQPNLKFWSDYADKYRWFVITNTVDQMEYSRDGNWTFPAGTMWVKHFDLNLDRGNTNTSTRIETRILVRTTNGEYGVSYRWNTNGTDATLVPDEGVNFDLNVTNEGVASVQQWRIPSRAECLVCHTPAGGYALSFNTRQLNREGSIAGHSDNVLSLLKDAGYISNSIDDPATLPRHVRPDEVEFSVESRARSYLAVNCGYCHMGTESIVPGSWDGRPFMKLVDTRMIYGEASSNNGNTNNLYVVPVDQDHSIIWNRIAVSNGFTRMPPLATFERDPEGIALISEWINGELASWKSYNTWRFEQFGSTNSPQGERDFDNDGDFRTNYEEFLTRTDPDNPFDFWNGEIIYEDGLGLSVGHDLYNRAVTIEVSTNLGAGWTRWDVAGNDAMPIASGTVIRISAPTTNSTEFFRYQVEEL